MGNLHGYINKTVSSPTFSGSETNTTNTYVDYQSKQISVDVKDHIIDNIAANSNDIAKLKEDISKKADSDSINSYSDKIYNDFKAADERLKDDISSDIDELERKIHTSIPLNLIHIDILPTNILQADEYLSEINLQAVINKIPDQMTVNIDEKSRVIDLSLFDSNSLTYDLKIPAEYVDLNCDILDFGTSEQLVSDEFYALMKQVGEPIDIIDNIQGDAASGYIRKIYAPKSSMFNLADVLIIKEGDIDESQDCNHK